DYNKAIHLMNLEVILDNNFLLLKKTQDLHAPIGMLYYHEYSNNEQVHEYLKLNGREIQCIIGHGFNPFGLAQKPKVDDYADNIDTMKWLASLPF
ncbi:MAG: acyl-CoA reductase, partial [Crocinitomicaceae bacterium]